MYFKQYEERHLLLCDEFEKLENQLYVLECADKPNRNVIKAIKKRMKQIIQEDKEINDWLATEMF